VQLRSRIISPPSIQRLSTCRRLASGRLNVGKTALQRFQCGDTIDTLCGNLGRDILARFGSFTLGFSRMTFSLGPRLLELYKTLTFASSGP
jgi:hypothetical protein